MPSPSPNPNPYPSTQYPILNPSTPIRQERFWRCLLLGALASDCLRSWRGVFAQSKRILWVARLFIHTETDTLADDTHTHTGGGGVEPRGRQRATYWMSKQNAHSKAKSEAANTLYRVYKMNNNKIDTYLHLILFYVYFIWCTTSCCQVAYTPHHARGTTNPPPPPTS